MIVGWKNKEETDSKVYGGGKVVLVKAERVTGAKILAAGNEERAWCMPGARAVL